MSHFKWLKNDRKKNKQETSCVLQVFKSKNKKRVNKVYFNILILKFSTFIWQDIPNLILTLLGREKNGSLVWPFFCELGYFFNLTLLNQLKYSIFPFYHLFFPRVIITWQHNIFVSRIVFLLYWRITIGLEVLVGPSTNFIYICIGK